MSKTEGPLSRSGAAWARAAVKTLRWDRQHAPGPDSAQRVPYRAAALVLSGLAIGSLAATLSGRMAPEPEIVTAAALPAPAEQTPAPEPGIVAAAALPALAKRAPAPEPVTEPVRAAPETSEIPGRPDDKGASPVIYEELVDADRPAPSPPAAEIEAAIARASVPPLPERRPARFSPPAWVANAVPVSGVAGRPMIAMVIDDLGLNRINANRAIDLPAPLTLAFMTYAERLGTMTARARAAGHELMVHMPMEPSGPGYDPGPNALLMDNEPEELLRRLEWGLGRFEGYVGINNHMGSRFTGSLVRMARVLAELRARGLIFLDSRTSGASVGADLARRMGVPHAARDVFIDNDPEDRGAIRRQLTKLETIALERGFAVGIGHPHDATIEVLGEWLRDIERRGFALVPVSAIVQHRVEVAATDLPPR